MFKDLHQLVRSPQPSETFTPTSTSTSAAIQHENFPPPFSSALPTTIDRKAPLQEGHLDTAATGHFFPTSCPLINTSPYKQRISGAMCQHQHDASHSDRHTGHPDPPIPGTNGPCVQRNVHGTHLCPWTLWYWLYLLKKQKRGWGWKKLRFSLVCTYQVWQSSILGVDSNIEIWKSSILGVDSGWKITFHSRMRIRSLGSLENTIECKS